MRFAMNIAAAHQMPHRMNAATLACSLGTQMTLRKSTTARIVMIVLYIVVKF